MTKDRIITKAMEISCERGLQELSISALAQACGLAKSTLYSHFSSKEDIISQTLAKCKDTLAGEIDRLKLSSADAREALEQLAFFLYEIFSESDSGLCYRLVQSEKLRNRQASLIARQMSNMLSARAEVLLDILCSKGKLRLGDTHYGAMLFCYGIESLTTLFLMRQQEGEKWNEFSWEIDKFCEGFLTLAAAAPQPTVAPQPDIARQPVVT